MNDDPIWQTECKSRKAEAAAEFDLFCERKRPLAAAGAAAAEAAAAEGAAAEGDAGAGQCKGIRHSEKKARGGRADRRTTAWNTLACSVKQTGAPPGAEGWSKLSRSARFTAFSVAQSVKVATKMLLGLYEWNECLCAGLDGEKAKLCESEHAADRRPIVEYVHGEWMHACMDAWTRGCIDA